jgi:hypothetical protein
MRGVHQLGLSGAEAQLAAAVAALQTAAPGPGLQAVAAAVRVAASAAHGAPKATAAAEGTWSGSRGGSHVTAFGPDAVLVASMGATGPLHARLSAGARAVQVDWGNPAEGAGGDLAGLAADLLRGDRGIGSVLGGALTAAGQVRVRLIQDHETLADWTFGPSGPVDNRDIGPQLDEAVDRFRRAVDEVGDPDSPAPVAPGGAVGPAGAGSSPAGAAAAAAAAGAAAAAAAAAARLLTARARRAAAEQAGGGPRFCAQCGAQLRPQARFCARCGTPVPGAPPEGPAGQQP